MQLKKQIYALGEKLVKCPNGCDGVEVNLSEGILPRSLILETRRGKQGVIVIGINPGRARKSEQKFYRDNGGGYKNVVEYWQKDISQKHKYYKGLRKFVNEVGLRGPILWTELFKCQCPNKRKIKDISMQTYRRCFDSFLCKELKYVPKDWPIIAVGNDTYKTLALMYRERGVIGVLHPSTRYSRFRLFFGKNSIENGLRPKIKDSAKKALNRKEAISFNSKM